MIPHPITIHNVTELRRQELLTTVKHERQAVTRAGIVLPGGKWPFVSSPSWHWRSA
jgi:hypothetical protein